MATTCTKKTKGVSATISSNPQSDRITEIFQLISDSAITDPIDALNAAVAANPTQFPVKGAAWPVRPTYGLFAKEFNPQMESELGKKWEISVSYMPLEPGEPNKEGTGDNPLLWPRTYRWDWVEFEEAVTVARNVEAFTGGFGRAAGTLGPVVNPAYQEYAEGLFHTVREAVLSIRYNVATLQAIADIEDTYQRTTNSDVVRNRGPRRWEYIGVEDGDSLISNGIEYRPIVIRCKLTKTTDRKVNSVGWKAFNNTDGTTLVPAMVAEEDADGNLTGERIPASEPLFIGLNGKFTTTATTNTWQFLEEVPYAPLING